MIFFCCRVSHYESWYSTPVKNATYDISCFAKLLGCQCFLFVFVTTKTIVLRFRSVIFFVFITPCEHHIQTPHAHTQPLPTTITLRNMRQVLIIELHYHRRMYGSSFQQLNGITTKDSHPFRLVHVLGSRNSGNNGRDACVLSLLCTSRVVVRYLVVSRDSQIEPVHVTRRLIIVTLCFFEIPQMFPTHTTVWAVMAFSNFPLACAI